MKILKMYVNRKYANHSYYCLFDEIPETTYEKIGCDYVGSAVDESGNVIFSSWLKRESYGNAFAGREISLPMKDGTVEKIKDYWFDRGSYPEHGEFVSIGCGTLEQLQNCYVYYGCCINKKTFETMLADYYSREKEYEYNEIQKWCNLQHKWYGVVIGGKNYPYMVNKFGDFVDAFTKESVYVRHNIGKMKKIGEEYRTFNICLFKLKYHDGDRIVKIEKNMFDVLRESLTDLTDEEIIKNCKLEEYMKGRICR